MDKTRARESILDAQYIREALDLDHETGILYWRTDRPVNHFKNHHGLKIFLSKFAGKPAGYIKQSDGDLYYKQIRLKSKLYMAHRIVWNYITGEWPSGVIDHLDGNGLNNKIENLRDVSQSENTKNRVMSNRNSSGYTGIYFSQCAKKWIAEGGHTYLGCFTTKEDAIAARVLWECKDGEFTERHGKERRVIV